MQKESTGSVYNVTIKHRTPTDFLEAAVIWLFSLIFQHSNLRIQVNITEANRVFIFILIWHLPCKSGELMVC